jgi:1-acyl-sn-glycerol-3-phosphate acyltransferase
MNTTIGSANHFVSTARQAWYGMRPIWWRNYWGLNVVGLEKLPKGGAMIFCANHTSHLDAAAILAALPRQMALEVTTVAAADVWGERPLRQLVSKVTTNSLSVARKGDFAAGFRMLDAVLQEGRPIILFPEGKRSVSGELLEFKPGAAMLAIRNEVPIVPVQIEGANEVMPVHRVWPGAGNVTVRFGEAIWPGKYCLSAEREEKKLAYARIMQELRKRILGLRARYGRAGMQAERLYHKEQDAG